jgi:hypothetical protein
MFSVNFDAASNKSELVFVMGDALNTACDAFVPIGEAFIGINGHACIIYKIGGDLMHLTSLINNFFFGM